MMNRRELADWKQAFALAEANVGNPANASRALAQIFALMTSVQRGIDRPAQGNYIGVIPFTDSVTTDGGGTVTAATPVEFKASRPIHIIAIRALTAQATPASIASLLLQVLDGTHGNQPLFTNGTNAANLSSALLSNPLDILEPMYWPLDIHLTANTILTVNATTTNPAANATYTPIAAFIYQDDDPRTAIPAQS